MFNNYLIDSCQKGVLYLVTLAVIALLLFTGKKNVKFSYRVLIGMTLGLAVGLIFGGFTTDVNGSETTIVATIRPIGQLYLKLIQMVVIPLVLTAVIKSFTSLDNPDTLKRIGVKTLFWLLITTTIGAAIGFGFAAIVNLGADFNLGGTYVKEITPIETVFLNFFPSNIVSALGGSVVLPVIAVGLFISIAVIV